MHLIALLGLGLALLAMSADMPTPATRAPSSRYGVLLEFKRTEDPAAMRETFVRMREAGIGWLRIDFPWQVIEPTPGRFRWDRYDGIAAAAKANDIELLGILAYTAPWASRDPARRDTKQPPREPSLFARYAEMTVARYRDSVMVWEVWNEPDHRAFWKGSAEEYAGLLAQVHPVIKAANPLAQIVFGGLAQGGAADPRFLESVLAACRALGRPCFDIFAFHTNFRLPADIRRQFTMNRERLAAYGLDPPIWITEASYTSDPRHQSLLGYRDGEAAQARYLTDTIPLSLELGAMRVFWATLYDYPQEYGAYTASGLLTVEGRRKAAYETYRRLATGR